MTHGLGPATMASGRVRLPALILLTLLLAACASTQPRSVSATTPPWTCPAPLEPYLRDVDDLAIPELHAARSHAADILRAFVGAGKRQRAARWKAWARRADRYQGVAHLGSFVAEEQSPPLTSIRREDGALTVQPAEIAAAFSQAWGSLWKPSEDEDPLLRRALSRAASEGGIPPLQAADLRRAAKAMSGRKASGLDHWRS